MNETFMKEKPIFGLVLSMSLPMVLSMMVNALYNIVDSYFVAKISEEAMTALSLVYPIQNLINAVTIGFGVGINAVIAFFLGAQEKRQANQAATMGFFWNGVHGLALSLICIGIMPVFLGFFTEDAATVDYAVRYSRIAFAFGVIIACTLSFEKIFQSVGKMTVSMLSMLAGCITNIILDPVLIFGLGPFPALGIEGAALATGIGQTLTLLIYVAIYVIRPIPVRVSPRYLTFHGEINRRLYSIGIPAVLNLALPSLLISCLNGILAAFSESYVLVLGVYYKLQTFLYLTANGIVQGIRPLVGYNYGAKEYGRVEKIYRTALALSALIMVIGTALCLAAPDRLIGLFTASEETIRIGASALRVISIGFVVSAVSVTSCGALEGLGMGGPSLLISSLRYVAVIIPTAFLLSRLIGPSGVWNAFWVTEWVTAGAAYLIYRRKTAGRHGAGSGSEKNME